MILISHTFMSKDETDYVKLMMAVDVSLYAIFIK